MTTDTASSKSLQAVWIRVPQAVQLTGLSRSKIYELLAAGLIRNASLKSPGQRHGTRLIERESLLAFIESYVESAEVKEIDEC